MLRIIYYTLPSLYKSVKWSTDWQYLWGGGGETQAFIPTSAWDPIGTLPHAGALRGLDNQYLAVLGRLGDFRLRNPSYNSGHIALAGIGGLAKLKNMARVLAGCMCSFCTQINAPVHREGALTGSE